MPSPPPPHQPQHQPPPAGNGGNNMGAGNNGMNQNGINQVGNMAQMMQMLNQFSGMQGNTPGAGGLNPMMLAQLMGMLKR